MQTGSTTWFVNATQNYSALPDVCAQARGAGQAIHILFRSQDREAVLQAIPPRDDLLRPIELPEGSSDVPGIEEGSEVFFLPCSVRIDWAGLRKRMPIEHPHCLQPLFADPPRFNPAGSFGGPIGWWGWRAGGALARRILREPSAWLENGVELIEAIQQWPDPPRWQSVAIHLPGIDKYPITSPPVLTLSSSVLAVVSFYRCEEWLNACLTCLTQQTRQPDNIVVIDDSSPALPVDILERFPTVTLLSTARNIGPEKILNNIINATQYDAYMVQDPDDWSSHDRLEVSLRTAEQSGAELVGSHEFRVDLLKNDLRLYLYPPDVNYAMVQRTGSYVLHGASLISRRLATAIGGYDGRLKLAADTDFQIRASHAGRIVNLPGFFFFRRVRKGSLTTHDETGYGSNARIVEDRFMGMRALKNLELIRAGQTPSFIVPNAEPVGLIHHQGPKLRLSGLGLFG